MAEEDITTLRLRLVYEANQAVSQAITDIRKLKDETGVLSEEDTKRLHILEYQKTLLDGAGGELDKHTAKVHEAALAQRAIRQALEEAGPAHSAVATAVTSTATAHGSMGRGVLQTSYAVQDFTSVLAGGGGLTRALGSVQNNIPVLLTGLGVGAGLAGTISLVSVGLGACIPLLSMFSDGQEKAAEATKKHKEEADKLKSSLTNEQEEIKKAVDDYTKDANRQVIGQAIETALKLKYSKEAVSNEDLAAAMAGMPIVVGETAQENVERGRSTARGDRAQKDANRLLSTLSTDPSARAQVAQLSREHKGFPAGIAEFLQSVEESPEDRERAEQAIERDDPDQQYMERHKARRDQKNADADKFNANLEKQKRAEHQRRAFNETVGQIMEEDPASIAAARRDVAQQGAQRFAFEQKQEHDEAAAARQAATEATRAARAGTPEARQRQAMASQQGAILGQVQGLDHQNQAMGGAAASPEFMHQVASRAAQNTTLGLDIASAVQMAVQQTQAKIGQDFERAMRRQQQNSQSFYSP